MSKRLGLLFVVALNFSFCPLLRAEQQSTEQDHLAIELVQLLDYDSLFRSYLEQCQQSSGTYFDPDVAYRASPESFGGLSPRSDRWEDVRAIYRKYQSTVCEYLTAENFSHFFEREYAKNLSEEDLRAAIAFQRSPAGQRIQDVSVKINRRYLEYAQKTLNELHQRAFKQASEDIRTLIIEK